MNETMRREIFAQPKEVERAIPILRKQAARIGAPPPARIIAGGCGDSFFASQTAAGFYPPTFDYRSATALDICYYTHVRTGDLCILTSISGGTRRTVEAAAVARRAGARTVAITCKAESALAQACDAAILLPFTPISRRTPHTLDYTMTVVGLAALAEQMSGETFEWLNDLPGRIESAIGLTFASEESSELPRDTKRYDRWFFLGAGPGAGVAAYGSAKFHESGGLAAWSGELENFMHGANFMLEPSDCVCLVVHDRPSLKYATRLSESLRAVGASTLFIFPDGEMLAAAKPLPFDQSAALVTCAVPLQALCLDQANRRGLELEAPRGGRQHGQIHLDAQKHYMHD